MLYVRGILFGLCGVLLSLPSPAALLPAPPTVAIVTTAVPPTIDGVLADPAWQTAVVFSNFYGVPCKPDQPLSQTTRARLLCDPEWVYIGFECDNPAMDHVTQMVSERDGAVNRDESVEVLLDAMAGDSHPVLHQFLLNAFNVQADQWVDRTGQRNRNMNLPWQSATVRASKGWTAEIAIPRFIFGRAPSIGVNLCRNALYPQVDMMGAVVSEKKEATCWAPVEQSFSEYPRFGRLTGLERVRSNEVFLPTLDGARIGGYTESGTGLCYEVAVKVRTHSSKTGSVSIAVQDVCAGATQTVVVVRECAGHALAELPLTVPIATMRDRTVRVTLTDGARGLIRQSCHPQGWERLLPFEDAAPDRNYYTAEPAVRIRCRVRLPESVLRSAHFTVKMGVPGLDRSFPCQGLETIMELPLAGFPEGATPVTVFLANAAGLALGEKQMEIRKLAPRPGQEVKVDSWNRTVLRNGVPFFPFGLVIGRRDETFMAQVARSGQNAFLQWSGDQPPGFFGRVALSNRLAMVANPTDRALAECREFHTVPVSAAEAQRMLAQVRTDIETKHLPEARRFMQNLRDNPEVIGYYNVDEANLQNSDARLAGVELFHSLMREVDPHRPDIGLYARRVPDDPRAWLPDVVCYDLYFFGGVWGGRADFWTKHMLRLRHATARHHKASWIVLMAEALDPFRCPRILTPQENYCQAYLALVHGAKGLLYFVDTAIFHQMTWDTLSDLAQQMKVLGPAVTAPEVPQETTYRPGLLDSEQNQLPDVHVALFRHPERGHILLAVNGAPYPVDTRFSVSGLGAGKAMRLFRGDVGLRAESDTFTDLIETYGVRAYELELRPGQEPVRLAVEMTAHPEQAQPYKMFDAVKELGARKNRIPNPSFEDTTVPGVPDYIRPRGIVDPLMGAPGGELALETNRPFHGQHCLRISLPTEHARQYRGIRGAIYVPAVKERTPFVFSFYARSSPELKAMYVQIPGLVCEEGVKVQGAANTKLFDGPGPEWKRCEVRGWIDPALVPPDQNKGGMMTFEFSVGHGHPKGGLSLRDGGGTVTLWLDALQMEVGKEATPFADR